MKDAIQTLRKTPPPLIRTSADADVQSQITENRTKAAQADNIADMRRSFFRNFGILSGVIGPATVRTLFLANNARTLAEKNAVITAEMRHRKLPMHGDAPQASPVAAPPKTEPVTQSAPPAVADPVAENPAIETMQIEKLSMDQQIAARRSGKTKADNSAEIAALEAKIPTLREGSMDRQCHEARLAKLKN